MTMKRMQPVGEADHSPLRALRNERGSVLAFMVLLLFVFLGLCAMAIDLGMLHVARSEAQRSADAAAHGGAAYLLRNSGATEAEIKAEAIRLGQTNRVRGGMVSIEESDVEVIWAEHKVRAWVGRTQERLNPVRTLFAGILGITRVDVAASAAAEIWPASHAECLLPVALPDRWCEEGDGTNCTRYPDETDDWDPEVDEDYYVPWVQNPDAAPDSWTYNDNFTGYSDANRGDSITLRPQSEGGGGGNTRWNPSWWNAFRVPGVDDGGNTGGTDRFRDRVKGCLDGDRLVGVGDDVQAEPGNFAQPAKTAFDELIALDATATWNTAANGGQGCVTSSGSMDCRDSVRIRPMLMFNPLNGPDNGAAYFPIGNLVAVFIDSTSGGGANVQIHAIFVEYTGAVPASRTDGSSSSFKILRIVE